MVYHSTFGSEQAEEACACSLLPLRTSVRGPAPPTNDADVIDEAINYYRANVLFRTFDVKGGADRTLIYLQLFIGQCMQRLTDRQATCKTKADGAKAFHAMCLEPFLLPGDVNFALGGFVTQPKDRKEAEAWRSWMKQAREELTYRLLDKCYTPEGSLNKYWMAFACRKLLNKQL